MPVSATAFVHSNQHTLPALLFLYLSSFFRLPNATSSAIAHSNQHTLPVLLSLCLSSFFRLSNATSSACFHFTFTLSVCPTSHCFHSLPSLSRIHILTIVGQGIF